MVTLRLARRGRREGDHGTGTPVLVGVRETIAGCVKGCFEYADNLTEAQGFRQVYIVRLQRVGGAW